MYILIKKTKYSYMIKNIIIGLIAGFISGLFGAGGGLIVVPALIHFLDFDEKKARATAIFIIFFLVLTSSFFYIKNEFIDVSLSLKLIPFGIVGGYIGALILKKVPDMFLRISYAIFVVYVAVRMIAS